MMSHFLMRLGVAFYPGGCGQVLIIIISAERMVGGLQEALVLDVGNLGETWP